MAPTTTLTIFEDENGETPLSTVANYNPDVSTYASEYRVAIVAHALAVASPEAWYAHGTDTTPKPITDLITNDNIKGWVVEVDGQAFVGEFKSFDTPSQSVSDAIASDHTVSSLIGTVKAFCVSKGVVWQVALPNNESIDMYGLLAAPSTDRNTDTLRRYAAYALLSIDTGESSMIVTPENETASDYMILQYNVVTASGDELDSITNTPNAYDGMYLYVCPMDLLRLPQASPTSYDDTLSHTPYTKIGKFDKFVCFQDTVNNHADYVNLVMEGMRELIGLETATKESNSALIHALSVIRKTVEEKELGNTRTVDDLKARGYAGLYAVFDLKFSANKHRTKYVFAVPIAETWGQGPSNGTGTTTS